MKNLLKKLTTILLLTLLMVIQTPVVFVQAATTSDQFQCEQLNNQNASAPTASPAAANDSNGGTENPTKTSTSLNGKLVVITEEPLGTADEKTTHLCARQIKCTGKETTEELSADKSKASSSKSKTNDSPRLEVILKRTCVTTYVNSSSCSATSKSDIDTAMGKPVVNGESFTICEPVMVYVSPAGTALLYYYIGQIYRYMATLGGTIAVLILIVGGIMRASAGDSADRISKANAIITKCISGLVLLFLSAIILYAINPNFFVI